jgi:hypothetical protein
MTTTPPVIAPLNPLNLGYVSPLADVNQFTYRDGISYAELVESVTSYVQNTLVPYINTEFPLLSQAYGDQLGVALSAIANNSIQITDPAINAVLQAANSVTRVWLDAHYAAPTATNTTNIATNTTAITANTAGITKLNRQVGDLAGFNVLDAGAVGDGNTDDRAAIQTAIAAANAAYTTTGVTQRVYFPARTFMVGAVPFLNIDGSTNGAVSLVLLSGVELFGPGTIKVKAGAYGSGALFGAIRSTSSGISNAAIRGITVDGNKTNNVTSSQCSNILLTVTDDVTVADTHNVNANGNGILLSGLSNTAVMTRVRVRNNTVSGANAIGIQGSQFNGLDIIGNQVTSTGDNSIDIYGENGSTTASGQNWQILNNRCSYGLVGVFTETVANGIVAGNYVYNCTAAGFHVNRINGAPTSITVTGNQFTNNPIGMYITGDMGSVYIRGNTITGATTAGVQMGGGGANLSHIYMDGNFIDTATLNAVALVLIATGTNTWSKSLILRTLTQNTNRSYDVVNYATTTTTDVAFAAANT